NLSRRVRKEAAAALKPPAASGASRHPSRHEPKPDDHGGSDQRNPLGGLPPHVDLGRRRQDLDACPHNGLKPREKAPCPIDAGSSSEAPHPLRLAAPRLRCRQNPPLGETLSIRLG